LDEILGKTVIAVMIIRVTRGNTSSWERNELTFVKQKEVLLFSGEV
jgi:hypothetical protein